MVTEALTENTTQARICRRHGMSTPPPGGWKDNVSRALRNIFQTVGTQNPQMRRKITLRGDRRADQGTLISMILLNTKSIAISKKLRLKIGFIISSYVDLPGNNLPGDRFLCLLHKLIQIHTGKDRLKFKSCKSVIFGFKSQTFRTRFSRYACDGIQKPELIGLSDKVGNILDNLTLNCKNATIRETLLGPNHSFLYEIFLNFDCSIGSINEIHISDFEKSKFALFVTQ